MDGGHRSRAVRARGAFVILLVVALQQASAGSSSTFSDAQGDETMNIVVNTPVTFGSVTTASGACPGPSADIRSIDVASIGGTVRAAIHVGDLDARPRCAMPQAALSHYAMAQISYRDEIHDSAIFVAPYQTPTSSCIFIQGPGPSFKQARTCADARPANDNDAFVLEMPEQFDVTFDDGTTYKVDLVGRELSLIAQTDTLAEGPQGGGFQGQGSAYWDDVLFAPPFTL